MNEMMTAIYLACSAAPLLAFAAAEGAGVLDTILQRIGVRA